MRVVDLAYGKNLPSRAEELLEYVNRTIIPIGKLVRDLLNNHLEKHAEVRIPLWNPELTTTSGSYATPSTEGTHRYYAFVDIDKYPANIGPNLNRAVYLSFEASNTAGDGKVRLYNDTDSAEVASTETALTSAVTHYIVGAITLASGKKKYELQSLAGSGTTSVRKPSLLVRYE